MAPEVMSSKKYGTAADMFSIGLILYELFHGTHPLAHLFNKRYIWPFLSHHLNQPHKTKNSALTYDGTGQYQGEDVAEKHFPPTVKILFPVAVHRRGHSVVGGGYAA